jgi:hypothetical protein
MTASSAFCRSCAAQSLQEAGKSTLHNVRNRHLRSAAAWKAMADRAARLEDARLVRETEALARKLAV